MKPSHSVRLYATALFTALIAVGCVGFNLDRPISAPFNEADFEASAKSGTAVVQGQAFAKTRGGDVKLGAGNEVRLYPVNTYTTEARNTATSGFRPKHDPRFFKYVRKSTADAQGNFEFRDLPGGEYFVECSIFWEVGNATTGGVAHGRVKAEEGKAVKVLLTP